MRTGSGWRSPAAALGIVLSGALLAACSFSGGMLGPGSSRFTSNGERIYFTATSDSGAPISYQGGPGDGMLMGRLACANCHGANGTGGRVMMMMQAFDVPNITWPALTQVHRDGGAMEHSPYTEETVRRAITQGLDPAGQPLNSLMPRWRMTERDLVDLIGYVESLP